MINLTYTQNLKTQIGAINANKKYVESRAYGTDAIANVSGVTTYSSLITKINAAFDSLEIGTSVYTPLVASTRGSFVSGVNDGFDDLLTAANAVPFFIDVKTPTITGKGTAKILAQQDSWKLAFYGSEDMLYLSSDNGVTWAYSKAFTDCLLIRTAWVFKDGSVIIGRRDNKMFSSQDHLSTINEITVYDGENPLAFHEPVNPSYPGSYFSSGLFESGVKNGVEICVFGGYSFNDGVGASPRILYYTIDKGVTIKVAYKFGQLATYTDDGTATGGADGTPLGDAGNEFTDDHVHFIAMNEYDGKFYIQTGDTNNNFLTGDYNIVTDTWTFEATKMTQALFRAVGIRHYNNGNNVLWTSDGPAGGVLTCTKENWNSTTVGNHTYNLEGGDSFIGLTAYGQKMLTSKYSNTPAVYISVDYGVTWVAVPVEYWAAVATLAATRYPLNTDSDGYILFKTGSTNGLFGNATATYLIKITPK